MTDSRPIGVFDSGVGGLTVLRELRRQLPAERLLYVADLEHFPYGPRPQRQVRDLAMGIIAMLVAMDTKLVVIACNTATAAALNVARERFDIPIIGVIAPGAQAAAAATQTGRVAVLSTEGTRASGEYVHAIREANPGVLVLSEAAPDLVEIVEDGDADTARAEAALEPVLDRIFAWEADTLVLGCTHYPLLRPALDRLIGERRLRVVDSADTTAARVSRVIAVNHLDAEGTEAASAPPELMVTAHPGRFSETASRLFEETLPAPRLVRPAPPVIQLAAGFVSIAAEELLEPIAAELREFEVRLDSEIASDLGPMASAMSHIVKAGGKRLRPALVILSARLGTADPDDVFNLAMGIEFIHTATLVHDDLIDKAPTRRGITTIHEALGPDPAVIIGDYYFAKGAYLLAEIGIPAIDSAISQAVMTICMGELLQMTSRNAYDQSLDDYHRKIARKTATLVSTCCYGGGIIAGLDTDAVERLRRYGHSLGMAFQIADDVLDYVATSAEVGKPVGADLRQGTVTLPLMLARDDPNAGPRLREILDKRDLNDSDFEEVVILVRNSTAIADAERGAQVFAQQAAAELTGFPESEALTTLERVCDYVVERRI